MLRLALELLLAPALVAISTLAARRWDAQIGGLISAFPAVIGPVLLIGAQERGVAFAAAAANATLLGLAALGGFAVTYGWVARRAQWWVTVMTAWASAAALSLLIGWSAGGLSFPAGLVVAVAALLLAQRMMPRTGARTEPRDPATRPRGGVAPRMILTAGVVVLLAAAGQLLGPLVGGLLAALPILASILAAFTHHQDGAAAAVALLRGMLRGMSAFIGFCAVLALLIVPLGTALAFCAATSVALALQAMALTRRPRLGPPRPT